MFKWTVGTMWQYKSHTFVVLTTAMIMAVCVAAMPIVWQMLLDKAIDGEMHYQLVGLFIILILILLAPLPLLPRERLAARYRRDVRCRLFDHLIRLDFLSGSNRNSTERLLKANKGADAGAKLLSLLLTGHILIELPVAGWAMYYIAQRSNLVAAILFAFLCFFLLISSWFGRYVSRTKAQAEEVDNTIAAYVRERLALLTTIRIHRSEGWESRQHTSQANSAYQLEKRWICFMDVLAPLKTWLTTYPTLWLSSSSCQCYAEMTYR